MNRIVIWGIRVKELLALFALYLFSSWAYHIVIWLNYPLEKRSNRELFALGAYLDNSGIQYVVFFLFTIPIWWFIFRGLRKENLWVRISAHLVLLPAFVLLSKYTYYYVAELVGFYHLKGSGEIWDIYIPALFYQIQFAIFHVYEYFIENQKKLKLQGELKQAALKSELAAIKAQLNPHFLYNVFNTINASVPPEQEKTRSMIASLSDLFRYQLKASKEELVSLEEELEFVSKYLVLEKERFKERLHVDIKVSDDLLKEKIPPMILQPLVENSVKHGLSSLIEGGSICIYIFKEGGKLKFEISDTGVGIANKQTVFGKGVGLTNTKLRLQKMYHTQLELIDNAPKGLIVKFAL